jgi:hypothetical protein
MLLRTITSDHKVIVVPRSIEDFHAENPGAEPVAWETAATEGRTLTRDEYRRIYGV